jgi:hypothetical protein
MWWSVGATHADFRARPSLRTGKSCEARLAPILLRHFSVSPVRILPLTRCRRPSQARQGPLRGSASLRFSLGLRPSLDPPGAMARV